MHIHFRDGEMLQVVAPLTSKYFSGALVMPNLVPPVKTVEEVIAYKERISKAAEGDVFTPYMTLFFHDGLTREILEKAKPHILSIKLYPEGMTTNSSGGVKDFDLEKLAHIFEAMSDLQIPLNVHGEAHGFVLEREKLFMPTYEALAQKFPKLKIIMEHITTRDAIEVLEKYENIYATITLQHLFITLDDIAGGMLKPHLFCKPIAKYPHDRNALLEVALLGHPKVMFGSDSAPHPQHKKECSGCAAGVFSAPIILPTLVELFEKHNSLENLGKFLSENAIKIYDITPPEKTIVLEKETFTIPEKYGEVVPYRAGETLTWRIKEVV